MAQHAAPRPLIVLRHAQELIRGGAAEARLERPVPHRAVRDVSRPDPERRRLDPLLRPVVQEGHEPTVAPLEANDDEGRVRNVHRDSDARLDEIALGVAPEARGRGIGRALVAAFVARHKQRAATLRVGTQLANTASIRLLENTGFVREGYAREYLCINGIWQDHLLYGRLKDSKG